MEGNTLMVSGPLLGWRNPNGILATYLRIEGDAADTIRAHEIHSRILRGKRRGFGSVKVEARTGESSWSTSVFPQDYGWFLPVKAAIRRAEGLQEGEKAQIELTLL